MTLYSDKYRKYSARYEIYSYGNKIQLLPYKESLNYQNWLPKTANNNRSHMAILWRVSQ